MCDYGNTLSKIQKSALVCDEMVRLSAGIIGEPYNSNYSNETVEDMFNNWIYYYFYGTTNDITEEKFLDCFGLKRSPDADYEGILDFLNHSFTNEVRLELKPLQDLLDKY